MAAETVVIQLKGEDKFSQVYATFNSSSQKIEKQVKSLTQSLLLEGKSVGKTTNQLELMKLELMGASKAQIEAVKSAQIFRDKQVALAKSSGAVTQQFRFMRGGLGQVGHQVQDIAVQLQMGQNAMLVFGQQGSQIASLFGPHGAILGAFLAVGAAVATSFIPSMKKSKEVVKTLSEQINELNEDLTTATAIQHRYLLGQQALKSVKLNEQLEEDQESLIELLTNYNKANKAVADFTAGNAEAGSEAYSLAQAQDGANQTIEEFASKNVEVRARIDATTQALRANAETFDALKNPVKAASTEYEKVIKQLQRQVEATLAGADAAFIMEQRDKGATEAQAMRALELHQLNESIVENREAEEEAAEAKIAADKRLRDQQKRSAEAEVRRQENSTANLISNLESELASLTLSKEEMAAYNAEKSYATGVNKDLIVSLYSQIDAETALKDATEASHKAELKRAEDLEKNYKKVFDKIGDGFVDAITGAKDFSDAMRNTAKQVVDSLIKMLIQKYIVDAAFGAITSFIGGSGGAGRSAYGATASLNGPASNYFVPSMSGGGYTGNGSRSGGMDGKGGFPAILHPRETVVDHHQGQSLGGDGITINQTINVTTGVQQTVRAEIATLMPQIANAAKGAVADARMRGGNYSKMLGA